MKFSPLVARIGGDGADAWRTHNEARLARERGEDVILLSVGDPDLESPAPVIERAIACLRAGDTHYTPVPGRPPLREAIAALHRARTGQAATVDNALFCSGAQNALFAASLCLAGPGDEVIALEPLYPTYPATIEASGARLVRAPAPAALGFHPDLAALQALVTPRTRAIFLATPNNPSGVILSASDMAAIGDLAERHSLWVVADEVYAGLAPGHRVPGLAARLPDRVVTIGSLSKSHAMTGWRAGWMVAPEALVVHAEALIMCMLYGLPGFIQEAALTALGITAASESRMRDYCRMRSDFLQAQLDGIEGIGCVVPDAGMFMLLDVRATGLSGYDFMRRLYLEQRVSLLDGGAFGVGTSGFVRLCFATDESTLREAAARIRRFAAGAVRRRAAEPSTP